MNIRKKLLTVLLGSTGMITANSGNLITAENKKIISMKDCENRKQQSFGDKELNIKNNSEKTDNRVNVDNDEQKAKKEYEEYKKRIKKEYEGHKKKNETMTDYLIRTKQFEALHRMSLPELQKILLMPIGPYDYISKFPPGFKKK